MKYLITIAMILNLMGCANINSLSTPSNFVVKDATSQYGMKYHFILEKRSKISDMHNPFSKFILIIHYHMYTNTLGKVSGDKILFAKYDNSQPKPLSKSSTFVFTPNSVTIEGLQLCNTVVHNCYKTPINGKYSIKNYSTLKAENYGEKSLAEKDNYYK